MEADETNGQENLPEVSLADGTTCTVDAKDIEENGAALSFASGFSPDQVCSLPELGTGVKRKRDDETDDHTRKLPHSDPQEPESFADEALVNISTTVPIPISQDVTSQTFTTCTSTNDVAHQLAPALTQEAATATISLSAAVAALQAGVQITPESPIIPVTQPISVGDSNNSVNQAWFTTKEDKDNLHGKGVKWRQGMWSKEENCQLKSNIMEYCKVNNIADPNIIIFEMTKDDRKDFYRTIAKGIRRPLFAIYRRVLRMYDRRNYIGKYSPEEVEQLKTLKDKHGNDWATIGAAMGRSASSVKDRYRLLREHCHSGKWTAEEEQQLSGAVHELTADASTEGNITAGISWAAVAERVGTRSEKQCRSKWLNYLNWKEKGGREWTKQDEVQLITRIHEMNFHDENEIDWQVMSANWPSVRSPQWLRSKWWALKKHVPETNSTSFQDLVSYLYNTFIEMLQNKIERQEARFKSTHIPRASMVSTCGRPVHVTSLSNGPISSSGIAQTITVSSDGTITRDDDASHLTSSHNRFEVVQVTALTSQDIYNSQSTVQGTPSYIIQAPAGQTYIIQQPSGHLVRQTHNNELTAASNGLENNQQDQEVVMTAAVLQAHHAVQTLPEVGPEFTQAIVQTDISGPITASGLSTARLDQSLHDAQLHGSEDLSPAVEHSSLDAVTAVTSTRLESHVALSATLSQSELQLVQSSALKEGSDVSASSVESSAAGTQFDETGRTTNGTEHSHSAAQTYTSPPFQGPAAIAQTLDGTHLPDGVSSHLRQQINQTTVDPHSTVMVSSEHLEDVTVMSSLDTTSSPPSTCTIATLNNNNSDLSVNAIVPQVTLPDQILQSQSDEPAVVSPTSDAGVVMVSESSLSVTAGLPSQILHSYESSTLSPNPVPRSMAVSSSLGKTVTVTSGLEHTENIMEASDVLLHIGDLSIPVMTVSGAAGASQHEDIATVIAPQHEDIGTVIAPQHEDIASVVAPQHEDIASVVAPQHEDIATVVTLQHENATVVTSQNEHNVTVVAQPHEHIASVVALHHEDTATVVASLHEDIDAVVEQHESSAGT